jgi:CDP-2,3-bis-(O-geranylgeranyl)-sn-glycerol synthase
MDLGEYNIIQISFIVLWIMMPAYISNTIAVFTGGKYPIDQGKLWSDGYRVLGDGKTWSGLIGGTVGGIGIGYFQLNWGESIIENLTGELPEKIWGESPLVIFFLLAFGALFGDITASFFKRRNNLSRGDKSPILDMFDFIGMALFLTLIFGNGWLQSWIVDGIVPLFTLVVITPLLHRSVNILGFKLGVKNEPW